MALELNDGLTQQTTPIKVVGFGMQQVITFSRNTTLLTPFVAMTNLSPDELENSCHLSSL